MLELHFIRPLFLLGVPVALFLGWRLGRAAAGRSAWARACAPHLLAHLLVLEGVSRRSLQLPAHWLLAGVLAVAAIALAGPAWERVEQPVARLAAARVIVLDVSLSMDAPDLSPSRLARARFKVADILGRTREGQTGMVVFAGDAFVVSPLTEDTRTLTNLLPALATDVVPVQGARLDRGLQEARRLLEGASSAAGQIIVVSDSKPNRIALQEAQALDDAGFPVSVLAVGTAEGAPVPLAAGGFLRGRDDALILPKLDHGALGRLARAGGGRLETITADDTDIDRLLAEPLGAGYQDSVGGGSRDTALWQDRGPWLAVALLPFAALAFRRGWLLSVVLAASLHPPRADAIELGTYWRNLWQRPDQQAAADIARGQYARASDVAPGPDWRGSSQYRAGEFAKAADSFDKAAAIGGDATRAHYNRGNALARDGKLQDAIAAYDRALAQDGQFEDAKFNRALVEKLLEQQQQEKQESGGQNQQGEERQPPGDSARGEGDPSERRDGEQSDGKSEPADAGTPERDAKDAQQDDTGQAQRSEEQSADEAAADPGEQDEPADRDAQAQAQRATRSELEDARRQALEQWLRRIPDDPGGLLREKFALEHRRRGGARTATGQQW